MEKWRGSLSNLPGRTGTGGFRLLDRDLAVQIRLMWVLISCVYFRSDGLGPSGAGAAALTAGDHSPRRRGTGNSSDFGVSAFPSSKWSELGSGRGYETCVVHLDQELGTSASVAARAGTEAALGGEARRRNPFGGLQGLRPTKTSTKGGLRGCGNSPGLGLEQGGCVGRPVLKASGGARRCLGSG